MTSTLSDFRNYGLCEAKCMTDRGDLHNLIVNQPDMKLQFMLLAILLTLQAGKAGAQFKKTRGYASVAGGVSLSFPQFGAHYQSQNPWFGAIVRNRFLEFQLDLGQAHSLELDSTLDGSRIYVGFHLPALAKKSKGYRPFGLKGYMAQALIAGGYGRRSIGDRSASFLQLSPGLSFQIPYVIFDLRMRGLYVLQENAIKGYRGFRFEPEMSVQFDGLLELFSPQLVKGGTGVLPEYSQVWKERGSYYDRYGNRVSVGYYKQEITGWNSYTAYANDVKPFTALGINYRFAPSTYYRPATYYSGLSFSGRAGYFAFDLSALFGRQGFASSFASPLRTAAPAEEEADAYNDEEDFDQLDARFRSSVSMFQPELRVGFDVVRMLVGLLMPRGYGHSNITWATRFLRFHAGIGASYAMPVWSVAYEEEDAARELDDWLATNEYHNNPYNNARESRPDWAFSAYGTLELGALAFSWHRNFFSGAPLANGRYYTVTYLLPVWRINKAMKGKDPNA